MKKTKDERRKMTWHKEAIAAFLNDNPNDIDPKRAARKSESLLKKIFSINKSPHRKTVSSWSKKVDKVEQYDMDKMSRQVGELDGYTWADVGYGDIFECVRGDTLLDLCLRNNKSKILIDGLRNMGAPANNLNDLNDWLQECDERAANFNTFEGSLYFIPPHLQRIAGPDPLANHGLWQKRHFVFFPLDNTLEVLTPLVPRLPQPELCETPAYAVLPLAETKSSATSTIVPTSDRADGGGGGDGREGEVIEVIKEEEEEEIAKEKGNNSLAVINNSTKSSKDGSSGGDGNDIGLMADESKRNDSDDNGVVNAIESKFDHINKEISNLRSLQQQQQRIDDDDDLEKKKKIVNKIDKKNMKYVFEICYDDERKPPMIVAGATEEIRAKWIKAINKDKRGVPRSRTVQAPTINVHTG